MGGKRGRIRCDEEIIKEGGAREGGGAGGGRGGCLER